MAKDKIAHLMPHFQHSGSFKNLNLSGVGRWDFENSNYSNLLSFDLHWHTTTTRLLTMSWSLLLWTLN